MLSQKPNEHNNYDKNQNNQVPPPSMEDLGRKVGESIRSAAKEIGPAVSDAVKSVTNQINMEVRGRDGRPMRNSVHPYVQPQNQPKQPYQYHNHAKAPTCKSRYSGSFKLGMRNPYGVGGIVAGAFGLATAATLLLIFGIFTLTGVITGIGSLVLNALLLGGVAASGIGIANGVKNRKLGNRLRQYYALLERKNVCTITELAAASGQTPVQVKNDIRTALRKDKLPNVRMDASETTVMLGEEAYKLYLEAEKSREQRENEEAERQRLIQQDPEAAAMEEFKAKGKQVLQQISDVNNAIPGEEISGKIEKLSDTVERIFTYVERHPNKLPDIRKFMDYYLPTTLKLLREYRRYEEQDVQVASVVKTKKEISDTLDELDTAFTNLLENLYQDESLDVVTDIKVLQSMLRQEGLTGEKFEIEAEDQDGMLRL